MRLKSALWIFVIATSTAGTASAQARQVALGGPQSANAAPSPQPARQFSLITTTGAESPAFQQPHMPARNAYRAANSTKFYPLGPLKVQQSRNAFISELRLPLATFWSGRVQFAGMHQRLRSVHAHSAVVVADPASVRDRQIGIITPKSRTSYGGAIWLRL